MQSGQRLYKFASRKGQNNMLKQFFLFFSLLLILGLNAQTSYSVNGKKDYSFSETTTAEKVNEILSADDIQGFSFDPVRNKSIVELHFRVPNVSKYELIIVEHGDSARGFTPCLTINIKEDKVLGESFMKIDKYPLPYITRTFYRAKSVTSDGIIRYFPYVLELHDGDKESIEKHRLEVEKQAQENKKREEELLKVWEENKNKPVDESWRNLKPEIVSGNSANYNSNTEVVEWDENKVKEEKQKIEKKLEKVKEIEAELKLKLEELKNIMEE
jgi:hypothetical protein